MKNTSHVKLDSLVRLHTGGQNPKGWKTPLLLQGGRGKVSVMGRVKARENLQQVGTARWVVSTCVCTGGLGTGSALCGLSFFLRTSPFHFSCSSGDSGAQGQVLSLVMWCVVTSKLTFVVCLEQGNFSSSPEVFLSFPHDFFFSGSPKETRICEKFYQYFKELHRWANHSKFWRV